MPIYTVTFCTQDTDAGANPFRHTFFILSQYDENTKKMEVVDNWGFYGLPTTAPDSWNRAIKLKLGLDVDFTENHGMLRHEDLRWLDLGKGLHGVTFELTEKNFHRLQDRCVKMVKDQDDAIREAMDGQGLKPKPPGKFRIYPYEQYSPIIYQLEKAKARQEGRESRLKPFKLTLSKEANTCKVQALSLLDGILTPAQIKRLEGKHSAVSLTSGKLENIYLYSKGPLRKHIKSGGEVAHFRDWEDKDKGVKLYWAFPPQEVETQSRDVSNLFKVASKQVVKAKKAVKQLQRLEWLFINATFDERFSHLREALLTKIRNCYEAFATVQPKKCKESMLDKQSYLTSLFYASMNEDEKLLQSHIDEAETLFVKLYAALVKDCQIHDNRLVTADGKPVAIVDNMLGLAAYLTPDKKKEFCEILGKTYIKSTDRKESIYSATHKLEQIEYILLHSKLDEKYTPYRDKLVKTLSELRKKFPAIGPKNQYEALPVLMTEQAKKDYHELVDKCLEEAKQLFNSLYFAMVDDWKIESSLPDEKAEVNKDDSIDEEAVISYFGEDVKQAICKIIARNYLSPHKDSVEPKTDEEESRKAAEEFVNDSRILGAIAGHGISWNLIINMAMDTSASFDPLLFMISAFGPMLVGGLLGGKFANKVNELYAKSTNEEALSPPASTPRVSSIPAMFQRPPAKSPVCNAHDAAPESCAAKAKLAS